MQIQDRTPRTLLVTNDFPPKLGGIQSYLFGLLSCLDPSKVRVLAPSYPKAGGFDSGLPYEVFREPTERLYPSGRLLRRIRSLAAGTDVIQYGFALQSWVVAPLTLRRTGLPYVVFVHGAEVLLPLRLPGAGRLLALGTLKEAAAVFSVSEHTARGVERRTGVRPTVVRPLVDAKRFRPDAQGRKTVRERHGLGEGPVVLCVGRLTARKGQDRLIDVLPNLRRRFGATLLLVGGGPLEKRLRRRALRRGVEEHVVFAGRVPDGLLPAYYAAADVFAMPVRSRLFGMEEEGFGVVFTEAAAGGLPMVVGDSGGAPEALKSGATGYLINGGSERSVEKALTRLLGDEPLRRKMGAAARERAEALYGASAAGKKYREALSRVAGRAA